MVVSTGAPDGGKIVSTDAQGKLDISVLPTGIGADTAIIICSEDISAGDFVNIYDNTGTPTCRLADATTAGKAAHGFVLQSVSAAALATIYFEGSNNQVTGLTTGIQYLHTTAGACTNVSPSTAGIIVQKIGIATSATLINVEFAQTVELA